MSRKGLNLKEKGQKNSKNVNFSFNYTKYRHESAKNTAQMRLIARKISIEKQVKRSYYHGYTFLKKFTCFYSKLVCGLLFSSVKENILLQKLIHV
jgi:hypothetical protein